ncbi:MAG: response regulator transcription factor [Caldiserica bacterium]|jgi:DNA-binding response OmpR family regulator|nr:response regulator transcription factor [Caldisericota bacterium]MDH7562605.1 response regulator transcription factor [Caldisericota bacterium]
MAGERILVVEDEENLSRALEYNLRQEGWIPVCVNSGEDALFFFKGSHFDLVLLDIMLPGLSGLEVCKRIRSLSRVPIILLTARSLEEDKIIGLDSGADDYITKPFSLGELKARIRAHLRRVGGKEKLIHGDLEIDPARFQVLKRGVPLGLSRKEFQLLLELAAHPGEVFSSDRLLKRIWGDSIVDQKTLQVHIRWLREKIEDDPSNPKFIKTVRGVGYKFEDRP